MHITFVKKILASGEPCAKCADVEARLEKNGQMSRIDEVLVADERDPESPGMKLATELDVARAPFFVVREADEAPRVYTVYFKFAREILGKESSRSEQSKEILNDNPDLDFI
ncbi:MAG: hypothetical protein U5O39_04615 [Gammaproteobacteria bacterium]|nr:hypothetical protein [Gammaproteobacteria bacterium]